MVYENLTLTVGRTHWRAHSHTHTDWRSLHTRYSFCSSRNDVRIHIGRMNCVVDTRTHTLTTSQINKTEKTNSLVRCYFRAHIMRQLILKTKEYFGFVRIALIFNRSHGRRERPRSTMNSQKFNKTIGHWHHMRSTPNSKCI